MINYRKFNKEDDYDIMRNIIQYNCTKTGHLKHQIHIGNMDFDIYAFEEGKSILYKIVFIVSYKEKEIGFVLLEDDELIINVIEEFKYLTEDIIKYAEENLYKKGEKILIEANSEDMLLNDILEKRGFEKTDNFRFSGICNLEDIKEAGVLPSGFVIRLTEERDILRRVELFTLATGGEKTTKENYEDMMNSPSYSDAIDLVVENSEKEIIAYCTIWNDPISKTGVLEPVACVSEYRKRGIMKNTLLYGMNLLKEQGTKFVYVGTGGGNIAAQALYRSVGFVDCGRNYEWQKII